LLPAISALNGAVRSHFLVIGSFRCEGASMKSAYELAMERLSKSDPDGSRPLSPEQRERLSETDKVYKGKIAEREIFLRQQLDRALEKGDADEADKVRRQISSEKARLEEERDGEKERIRSSRARG
jgi:hypothetical protein